MTGKDRDQLEMMIDRNGLVNVLDTIAIICYDKADHTLGTWDDPVLAKQWQKAGRLIETLAFKVPELP